MILITGVAGFIGFHLCNQLLSKGHAVCGIDNLNDYYDVRLKQDRLKILKKHSDFSFCKLDLCDDAALANVFREFQPKIVVNLAAQAGVRYSIEKPSIYIQSNLVGFANIIEISKNTGVTNFVYASSSSVYGSNTKMPFAEKDSTSHQLSLYFLIITYRKVFYLNY